MRYVDRVTVVSGCYYNKYDSLNLAENRRFDICIDDVIESVGFRLSLCL